MPDPRALRDDTAADISVNVIMPALATVAVLLRFLARRRRRTAIGIDDWLIVIALVSLRCPQSSMEIADANVRTTGHDHWSLDRGYILRGCGNHRQKPSTDDTGPL